MASVRNLKEWVGELLAEPASAVNSRSMMLVKDGLLSSEGVGRTVKATATDATNLLLAFLGGSQATKVADNVVLLRSSASKRLNPLGKPLKRPPIQSLEALPEPHTLGDALDALIQEWVAADLRFSDTGKEVAHLSLSITRHNFGWDTEILVMRGRQHWQMQYLALRPEAQGLDIDGTSDEVIKIAIKNGDRKTEETISSVSFGAIAGLLRD